MQLWFLNRESAAKDQPYYYPWSTLNNIESNHQYFFISSNQCKTTPTQFLKPFLIMVNINKRFLRVLFLKSLKLKNNKSFWLFEVTKWVKIVDLGVVIVLTHHVYKTWQHDQFCWEFPLFLFYVGFFTCFIFKVHHYIYTCSTWCTCNNLNTLPNLFYSMFY